MKKVFTSALFVFISMFLYSQNLYLDKTFANEGRYQIELDSFGSLFYDGLILEDGSYISLGALLNENDSLGGYYFLYKFTENGIIDSSFAENGILNIHEDIDEILTIELLSNGNIAYTNFNDEENISISIIDQNGILLKKIIHNFGDYNYDLKSIVSNDKSLYIAGNFSHLSPNNSTDSIFVMKLNFEGVIDSSYGKNGVFKYGILDYRARLFDFEIQDQKVLIIGNVYTNDSNIDNFNYIIRLDKNGIFDDNFGENGIVIFDYDGVDLSKLKVDSEGDFYITFFEDPFILKYSKDGKIDTEYGHNGSTGYFNDSLELNTYFSTLNNGSIYFFGSLINDEEETLKPVILKFDSQGKIDTLFGDNGIFIPLFPETTLFYNGLFDNQNNLIVLGGTERKVFLTDDDFPYVSQIIRYNLVPVITNEYNINKLDISIYPNPISNDNLNIQYHLTESSFNEIKLLDINGRNIKSLYKGISNQRLNKLNLKLPVGLKQGLYLIQIKTNVGIVIKKVNVVEYK